MKTLKGSVAIEKQDNRIRLRWSCDSNRYCLALGLPCSTINLKVAQKVANQIELDIASGNFDPKLDKYRLKQAISPKPAIKPVSATTSLLLIWDKWVTQILHQTQ